MPMPPRRPKKPAADISILMPEPDGDEPKGKDDLAESGGADDLDDSFGEDDLSPDDMGDGGDDELAADGSTDIDPEQASLMADLGFSDPEQQQKLLDLIDMRISKGPGAAPPSMDSGSELPEGGY